MARTPVQQRQQSNNSRLQEAINQAGFSSLKRVDDLGFVRWNPPPKNTTQRGAPYRYKVLAKATVEEIRRYTVSNSCPNSVIDVDKIPLPITFQTNIPKQIVAQKFPYGKIGVAGLYHAHHSNKCDLNTIDFFFGCSALDILSAEKKRGKGDQAPYLVLKVPGTNIVMVQYNLNFGQDYSVPGFQFERLLTGQPLHANHDVGSTEHLQIMEIGNFRVLMTAEVDAVDSNGDPVEIKLLKHGNGGAKVFFQMVGSGSLTFYQGKNQNGSLKHIAKKCLVDMAVTISERGDIDVESLERKIIRNMEKLKEWNRQGHFAEGKAFRLDFDAGEMKLHPVSRRDALLPADSVVKELLGTG